MCTFGQRSNSLRRPLLLSAKAFPNKAGAPGTSGALVAPRSWLLLKIIQSAFLPFPPVLLHGCQAEPASPVISKQTRQRRWAATRS
jgi:hypothetical protein